MSRRSSFGAAALAAVLALPGLGSAQEAASASHAVDGWNSPRALELVERARERRQRPQVDSTLRNYQAMATGYVYFFLDRRDTDERTLVKVDQVALEVFWGAPNLTKQRIVGLRDRKTLPNNIHYHLDHLTVVQNEFDDRIHVGDGDEVRDVLHPAAPGSELVYDFRIADSLTLRLGGAPEPIRVYELEVRPKHPDRPAFVGSVFVDRASADIVRMTFTFTPASYVDPQLDYIRISLDNGLWEGRYWLPYEQRVELRRELRAFDFPAGSVIRGTMRIGDYRFNQELPPNFFRGPRVVAVPQRMRESFAFEDDLFAGLEAEGLGPLVGMDELRRRATELIGTARASGLPRLRLYLPNASSLLRYNRAEGAYAGAGARFAPTASATFDLIGGYAFGADQPELAAGFGKELGPGTWLRLRAERNIPRDLGMRAPTAGVLNTLTAAVAGKDYLDLYFATGAGATLERRLGGPWRLAVDVAYEEHRSATLAAETTPWDGDTRFRPVLPVDEGALFAARATLQRTAPTSRARGWGAALALEAGTLDGSYLRSVFEADAHIRSADRATDLHARAMTGWVAGDPPAQRLFLFGGPGTLPGFAPASFVGDRFALADVQVSRSVLGPWIRLRALAAAGWATIEDAAPPAAWTAAPTDGIRASAGIGVGLVYDILRIDLVRPLGGSGGWSAVLSVTPGLLDIL